MQKRGLSSVVVTVLIVLLVLVCIGLVYTFVQKNVKDSGQTIDETQQFFGVALSVVRNSYVLDSDGNLFFRVERKAGGKKVDGIYIVLEDSEGNTKVFSNYADLTGGGGIGEFESVEITILASQHGLQDVAKIKIYPIIQNDGGEFIVSPMETDVFNTLEIEETGSVCSADNDCVVSNDCIIASCDGGVCVFDSSGCSDTDLGQTPPPRVRTPGGGGGGGGGGGTQDPPIVPSSICGNNLCESTEDSVFCPADCSVLLPVCGNNITESGEQCDDENNITESCVYGQQSCTVCNSECQNVTGSVSYCGDGINQIEQGEECDDGNVLVGDGCDSSCIFECEINNSRWDVSTASEGDLLFMYVDGVHCEEVQINFEVFEDDPGSQIDDLSDVSPLSSTITRGTAVSVWTAEFDHAEAGSEGQYSEYYFVASLDEYPGVYNRSSLVLVNVTIPSLNCGNGSLEIELGEQCDDGNTEDDDGCDSLCQNEFQICGNGFVEGGEICDDGDDDNYDSCTDYCSQNVCGDGYRDLTVEGCDDGAQCSDGSLCLVNGPDCFGIGDGQCTARSGDGCDSLCIDEPTGAECGNSIIEVGEECDCGFEGVCSLSELNGETCVSQGYQSGSLECGPGCNYINSAYCINYICGDGLLWGGEQCEDGNSDETDACVNCNDAFCGDGFVWGGFEGCDDGNHFNGDGCSSTCQIEQPCVLSDAMWNVETATEGDILVLDVTGSACEGRTVNFTVYENDFIGDDNVNVQPQQAIINMGTAQTLWVAEYDVGDPGPTAEYYFVATLESDEGVSSTSPDVDVSQLIIPSSCGDDFTDGTDVCDGIDLNGQTCSSVNPIFTQGNLGCLTDCSDYDVSDCAIGETQTCGDGVIEGTEICECGDDLICGNEDDEVSGVTCNSLGYSGSYNVRCSSDCLLYDVNECGVINNVLASERTADMPDSWLVVYNVNSSESVEWANWYIRQWRIPEENLFGVNTTNVEKINTTLYNRTIFTPIKNHLKNNPVLDSRIMGIITGYRVPGNFFLDATHPENPGGGGWSVSNGLGDLNYSLEVRQTPNQKFFSVNSVGPRARLTKESINQDVGPIGATIRSPIFYMTARIDAPTLEQAKELTRRARAITTGVVNSTEDKIYYDYTTTNPSVPAEWDRLRSAVEGVITSNLGIYPWQAFGFSGPSPNASIRFSYYRVQDWDRSDVIWTNDGARVLHYSLDSFGATTVRSTSGLGGRAVPNALHNGNYTAAIGSTAEPFFGNEPWPDTLVWALSENQTLGEAFFQANPYVDYMWELNGDPLLRMPNWFN